MRTMPASVSPLTGGVKNPPSEKSHPVDNKWGGRGFVEFLRSLSLFEIRVGGRRAQFLNNIKGEQRSQ